jgi:hypothetical protein
MIDNPIRSLLIWTILRYDRKINESDVKNQFNQSTLYI